MTKELIGVDLKAILRVKAKTDELGYDRPGLPMDHYYLNMNRPLDVFDPVLPQAIVNIGIDSGSVTCFVQKRWFDNISTVKNVPPGYEKVILVFVDDPVQEDKTYDN